jgi:DNA-binding NarL/FixJ family response regulator
MKALIIEDHALFAQAFKYLLIETKLLSDILIETKSENSLEIIQKVQPMLLFLDLNMPNKNGFDILSSIQSIKKKPKVIIVSMVNDASIIAKALLSGANGFVPKNTSYSELHIAIQKVINGEIYFPDSFANEVLPIIKLQSENTTENDSDFSTSDLSIRELEILKLIAYGYTNNEISEKLFISPLTVKTHRTKILKKLNIKNTAALINYASNMGLI